ncbi:MAG: CoA transferase [Actinomycetota bacterium]
MPTKEGSGQGPLHGVRIVDLTTVIMAPMATRILGDMGADIVRVETSTPELMRNFVPQRSEGMSGVALNLHRNKRSVALDLKSDDGKRAMYDIVASADALVSNIRPAALARLGLSPDDLLAVKPDLVYVEAVGFGSDGPNAGQAAYDDVIQSVSGLAAMFSWLEDEPKLIPSTIADKIASLHIVYAVLAGLFRRATTGQGDVVEVPMAESLASFNLVEHLNGHTFEPREEPFSYLRIRNANRKPRRSKDGWICLLPYSDQNYQDFFAKVDRPDLAADPRFTTANDRVANAEVLYGYIDEHAGMFTNAEWLEYCEAHSIPAGPVQPLESLDEDPHFAEVGLLELVDHPTEGRYRVIKDPVKFASRGDWELERHAPRIGQHTAEILTELGWTPDDIEALDP